MNAIERIQQASNFTFFLPGQGLEYGARFVNILADGTPLGLINKVMLRLSEEKGEIFFRYIKMLDEVTLDGQPRLDSTRCRVR
jgi:hypothetical protein